MERWLEKRPFFEGRIFQVVAGTAVLDDGLIVSREMVVHGGGVAIVPVLGAEVVLIRQFRIAVGKYLLELPAGRLEGDELPEKRAQQELKEEVGYEAGRLVTAVSYYTSAGFTNERMHIFLAFDLKPVPQQPEFDEQIEIVRLPLAQIPAMLATHAFEDAKTIIGLRELLARLKAG